MTIDEVTKPDPLKAQADNIKRQEQALKQKRARIGVQKAQQQLRSASQV